MKLCECGCGRPTLPYKQNDRRIGAVKGQSETKRKWMKNNMAKIKAGNAKMKAKRRSLEISNEPLDLVSIYATHKGICGICDLPVSFRDAQWDHIVALTKGGAHAAHNLQPSHPFCNMMKGNRPLEWARQRIKERKPKNVGL